MRVGAKIAKILGDLNLGDREAAKRLGIKSASTVGRWRKGETEPSISETVRFAEEFKVPLNYLAYDTITSYSAYDTKIWELVRELGPEKSWRRLILAETAVDRGEALEREAGKGTDGKGAPVIGLR